MRFEADDAQRDRGTDLHRPRNASSERWDSRSAQLARHHKVARAHALRPGQRQRALGLQVVAQAPLGVYPHAVVFRCLPQLFRERR